MRTLLKTTIVIWSEVDCGRDGMEIDDLASDAMDGESYCSKQTSEVVENPQSDPDWEDTEFFGVDEDEEN